MGNIQGRLGLLGAQHGVQDSPRELRVEMSSASTTGSELEDPISQDTVACHFLTCPTLPQYLLFPYQGDKNVIPYPDWECELDRAWTPFPMCHSHTMELHCIGRARCRSQISWFLEQRLFPTLRPSLPLLFQAAGVSTHLPLPAEFLSNSFLWKGKQAHPESKVHFQAKLPKSGVVTVRVTRKRWKSGVLYHPFNL